MKNALSNPSTLDIFLSELNPSDYSEVKSKIESTTATAMPLLSWDIFMDWFRQNALEHIKKVDRTAVLSFAKKFKWQNDLESTLATNDYEAIIITDKNQKILWVNEGFTAMTGYAKKDALDNTPRFLQGEQTSLQTKKRIKSKLALDKPFREVIVNHRKDNSTYKCEVKIFPLYNNGTTHYIALERKVG